MVGFLPNKEIEENWIELSYDPKCWNVKYTFNHFNDC